MSSNVDWGRYDDVLHEVYAAAMEPSRWPAALGQIADLWQASKAILFSFTVPDGRVQFNIGHNISARGLQTYATRTANTDPFVVAAYRLGLASEGNVTIGESHVSREDVLKTDFYREVWEPEGIGQTCYAVIFDGTDSKKAPVILSLMRSLEEPCFVEFDRDMLKRMLKHLSRAMGVMFHLRSQEFKTAASRSALDTLAAGVVMLDASQAIQFKNQAAQHLLKMGAPLCVISNWQGGREVETLALAPQYGYLSQQFERMLKTACMAGMRDEVDHFSDALIVADEKDGRPQCVIHAAPLVMPDQGFQMNAAPQVILFVYNLHSAVVRPSQLEKLFALTPGESRAALQMLQGGTVNEMSNRLGVTPNTFKTQLKAAYGKTMTHRQSDLLKLLLALSSG